MDILKVNEDEQKFYEKGFVVWLWPGSGYFLQGFKVYTNDIENALEKIVTFCEQNDLQGFLLDVDMVEDEEDDNLIYVDGTIEGATKPYYIFSENLRVDEI